MRDVNRKKAEMLQEVHRLLEKGLLRFKNEEEAAKLGPDPYPFVPYLSYILDNLDIVAKREYLEDQIKDIEGTLLEDARFEAELESLMTKIDKERLRLMEKESGQKARQSPVAPRS